MADLVSLKQLAERLGVPYRTAVQWRHRQRLPAPALMAGRSPVWEWPTVERWALDTGRLKEREHP